MEKGFIEKIVCNNCKNISYRDLKSINISDNIFCQKILALVIQNHACANCNSDSFESYIIENKTENTVA